MTSKHKSRAKAVTKARKAKRPKLPTCPVERLGCENGNLCNNLHTLQSKMRDLSGGEKRQAEETILLIEDRMRSNRHAATFLQPRSLLGVGFLVCSAYADIEGMLAGDVVSRDAAARRAKRALCSIADFLFYDLNVAIGVVGSPFYIPRPHPNTLLAPFVQGAANAP